MIIFTYKNIACIVDKITCAYIYNRVEEYFSHQLDNQTKTRIPKFLIAMDQRSFPLNENPL